jgi:hypothetical protein
MHICVDHKGPLESCDIDPLYIDPCVPMLCGMKNGENVSGRGRHSHPEGIYRNPVLVRFPPILCDRYDCAIC